MAATKTRVKLRPMGDKVVVKPGQEEEVSKGGIVLPDMAKQKPQEGEIIAVGSGRLLNNGSRAPLSVKMGDTVIYSKYGGTEITVDDADYVVLDEDQILAVKE